MVDSRNLDVLQDILALLNGTNPGSGSSPLRYPDTYNVLTTGQPTAPRALAAVNQSTGTQSLRLAYFTAWRSITTASVRVISAGTAAGATPSLARIGLYSIAANGDGTLVASTANDTALFAAANTRYTKAWSSPYALVALQRYALAVLVVTAATAPTILGTNVGDANEATEPPRLNGVISGQADLPASFLAASVGPGATRPYAVLVP